jgi:maltooligosyltrehalose trehalohydrolase
MRPEVWAPRATRVDLVVSDARRPAAMRASRDGWFASEDELEPGTDYGFSLDQSEPFPDPRSHWQPAGVFGPSRVVDHDDFEWTDDRWRGVGFAGSIVYELHIGTFSSPGTFDGATEYLDHLVELGVDIVEVMPVNAFDGFRGWGYDGAQLYAVHDPYGGASGFKRFVDAAHERGLGVFLDVVYNHFGPTGNHLDRFGPYTTDRHRTPWGDAVNLDGPGSVDVRRFFIDNARFWLETYHLDGLRLDAVHALVDDSETHFLAELAESVEALAAHVRRPLSLVAEYPQTEPIAVRSRDAAGHGLTAAWRDEVHHAIHAAMTGERNGYYAPFGELRDIAAAVLGPKEELPRDRFVACVQNHDQVGNRASGERLVHLVGTEDAKVAAALLLCGPFTPLLFMGEEWAASSPFPYFCGPRDDDLDEAVRRGRREEFAAFGWDPAAIPDPVAQSTFELATLRWSERDEHDHAAMLAWYRQLIRLRRARPELADPRPGSVEVDVDEPARTLVMRRGAIAVAVNLSNHDARVNLSGDLVLGSVEGIRTGADGILLPPHSVAVAVIP